MEPFMLDAQTLFDLQNSPHLALFQNGPVWKALDNLHDYLMQQEFVIKGEVQPGAILINPELIAIGEGSVVEPGAYIKGPCVIGKNCQIRHGAYIRGDLLACDHVVIGHATEVKNSIFLEGAQAGHFAYVGDSILGKKVNLGAGTKCANLRLDRKNIKIQGQDSGRRKLGAIFGDGAQTGCNVVTNPGTIMAKNSVALPCSTPKGYICESSQQAR